MGEPKREEPKPEEPKPEETKEEVIKIPDEDKTNYLIKQLQKIP